MTEPTQRVLIIGVGGLGCPASLALAAKGGVSLTLVDDDLVDVSNLHRQPWHHLADVGRPKVDSAAEKLRRAFPEVVVTTRQERLTADNALALFLAHDVVVDATDGVETKFLLSDAAVLTRTPLIYGGVLRFEGLALRVQADGPCLRCLFETPPEAAMTCAQAGVLGSMAGVIGGLQAELVSTPGLAGEAWLHVIDGAGLNFRKVRVRKRVDCAACGVDAKPVWTAAGAASCLSASTSPARSAP